MESKEKPSKVKKDGRVSLAPLDFEQALENLIQIKPERKDGQKKKQAEKIRKIRE